MQLRHVLIVTDLKLGNDSRVASIITEHHEECVPNTIIKHRFEEYVSSPLGFVNGYDKVIICGGDDNIKLIGTNVKFLQLQGKEHSCTMDVFRHYNDECVEIPSIVKIIDDVYSGINYKEESDFISILLNFGMTNNHIKEIYAKNLDVSSLEKLETVVKNFNNHNGVKK